MVGCEVCEAGPSYKKQKWTGEMAVDIKGLLCKHENLTSNPPESQALRSAGGWRWAHPQDLLAGWSSPNRQLQVH